MANSTREAYGCRSVRYQIVLEGKFRADWSDWLSGMEISAAVGAAGRPVTTLTGSVADQAALRGILCSIWNLNLTVLSVIRMDVDAEKKGGE